VGERGREVIEWFGETGTKIEVLKGEREVIYALIKVISPHGEESECDRKVLNGMVELIPHSKISESRWERINRTVKLISNFQVGQREGEIINRKVETHPQSEVSQGRRKVIDGMRESITYI
jgi:hypothetical protein